ncbi:hypothetical protein C7534_11028 [Pseudomonas sp. OV226]|jgi:hypothetical protein|nr:hypothetical protein C7534_11028 [Pseudomonas sp. OV226]
MVGGESNPAAHLRPSDRSSRASPLPQLICSVHKIVWERVCPRKGHKNRHKKYKLNAPQQCTTSPPTPISVTRQSRFDPPPKINLHFVGAFAPSGRCSFTL